MSSSLLASDSSLLDSSASSVSVLGASAWNRKKAEQPVKGKPSLSAGISGIGLHDSASNNSAEDEDDHHHKQFIQKRIYPALLPHSSKDVPPPKVHPKTELETAVLLDCLSNHFLFSQLDNKSASLNHLIEILEKIQFRKNEIIIHQGDPPRYFYILYGGDVQMTNSKEGKSTSSEDSAEKYTVFGELSLLTASPYEMTVKATSSPCTLFRLDRIYFQQILYPKQEPTASSEERTQLFQNAIPNELKEYLQDDDTALAKLVSGMTTHSFQKDDVLYRKGTPIHAFVVIAQGQVVMTDVSVGGRPLEDIPIGPGQDQTSFGWLTVKEDEPLAGTIVAASNNGQALVIPKQVFLNALGGGNSKCGKTTLQHVVDKRLAKIELQQLTVFQDSALDSIQLNGLLDLMHRQEYAAEEVVIQKGEKFEPALYFIRQGSVTIEIKGQEPQIIQEGGYFGEKNMLLDQNKNGQKHYSMRSPMIVTAHADTKLDVLYLEECRKVVDTTLLGLGQSTHINAIDASLGWNNLTRHTLLGSGSFGQVWLASDKNNRDSEQQQQPEIVALKVQPKHKLLHSEQATRVVAERNIMASLHSPFLTRLYHAFQDNHRLYMITSLLQGGELESLIPEEGLPENTARFYAAGILEGLTYMHRRHLLHRDVKTANVLLNEKGYPVLIDMGFAKYVADKTFTFCGSAMYTAPEIIRYKGHDKGCDHWSWAVLVYRLVTGSYPFYKKGMDELSLYKQICKGTLELDGMVSMDFRLLMVSILYPDPAQRLGSRVNGWRDIFASPWFKGMDLPKFRKQALPAPWVPDLKDPLDASRFKMDSSEAADLMDESFPGLTVEQQHIFGSFGPMI